MTKTELCRKASLILILMKEIEEDNNGCDQDEIAFCVVCIKEHAQMILDIAENYHQNREKSYE